MTDTAPPGLPGHIDYFQVYAGAAGYSIAGRATRIYTDEWTADDLETVAKHMRATATAAAKGKT